MKLAVWLILLLSVGPATIPTPQTDRRALKQRISSLAKAEKYKEAAAAAEKLVALEAKMGRSGSLAHCEARTLLADMLMSIDPDRARKICDETARGLTKLRAYKELANLYYTRASIEYPDNRPEEAKFYELGLNALAKLKSPPLDVRGYLLNDLGLNYKDRGEFSRAMGLLKRAVADLNRLGKSQLESQAVAMSNVGLVAHELGALQESIDAYEKAIKLEALAQVNPNGRAVTFLNFGSVLRAAGRLPEARTFLLRAQTALEGPFQEEGTLHALVGAQVGELFTELGLLYSSIGDEARSLKYLTQSLQAWQRTEGNAAAYGITRARNNLGTCLRKNGRAQDAIKLFQDAIPAYQKQFGGPSPLEAGVHNNLGLAYEDLKQYEEAERRYTMAMDIHGATLPKDHQDYGMYVRNRGLCLFRMGKVDLAEESVTDCIDNWRSSLGPGHPSLVDALHSRAMIRADLGKLGSALGDLSEATEMATKAIWSLARTGGESDALSYSSTFAALIGMVAEMTNKGQVSAERGYDLLLKLRGTAIRALIASQRSLRLQQKSPSVAAIVDEVRAARVRVSSSQPAQLEAAMRHLVLAESKLAKLIPGSQDREISGDMVQNKLPSNAVLVECVRFGPSSPQYGAFVVSRSEIIWRLLGDAREIDRQTALARAGSNAPSDVSLYETMFSAKSGKKPSQVWIVPDGSLHSYPFAALKTPGGKFLVEEMTLQWLASGRDLVTSAPPHVSGRSIIVANPDFGKSPGVEQLSGTAAESRAIQPLLSATMFTGKRATEEAIQRVRSPKVLHIATHGSFADQQTGSGGRSTNPATISANPLMRSCILMAGANDYVVRRKKGQSDGWLSAWEATSMDLAGTQLVVLSACKTGLGDLYQTEGVIGLRSALRTAGARCVVMSLDRVDDKASSELMKRFYRSYAKSKNPASALREAQRSMIADPKLRDPAKWSLFIVEGRS